MKQTSLVLKWRLAYLWWMTTLVFQLDQIVDATSSFPNPTPQGNSWAPCAFAAQQLAVEGNGSSYGSCLACDPTSFECPPKCQPLIDAIYKQCDGVYAPQDQYFDPAHTLNGYWNDNFDVLRVQAARCGCSDSTQTWSDEWFVLKMMVTVFVAAVIAT